MENENLEVDSLKAIQAVPPWKYLYTPKLEGGQLSEERRIVQRAERENIIPYVLAMHVENLGQFLPAQPLWESSFELYWEAREIAFLRRL